MRKGIVVLSALWAAGCNLKTSLPEMGDVPPFRLTTIDGSTFSSERLAGKIWAGNFFFTTCNGPCPRMSSQMRRLQNDMRSFDDVQFISFTIDPANDTPPALAAYARRFEADPARWFFLTGPAADLEKLSNDTFHLGSIGGPQLEHSSRFVLVDRKSRLRGYYDSSDPAAMEQLRTDIAALRKEVL